MNHCGPLWSVKDNKLQQVPSAIGAEQQIPDRIVRNFLDHDRVLKAMLDVLVDDTVATARREIST